MTLILLSSDVIHFTVNMVFNKKNIMQKLIYKTLTLAMAMAALQVSSANAQVYLMPQTGTQTIYTSKGRFFDSGGPGTGAHYSNNENGTLIVCPSDSGQFATVVFYYDQYHGTPIAGINLNDNGDKLRVYNGIGTSGSILADFTGFLVDPGCTTVISVDTANGGCLTFTFQSNGSGTAEGWQALFHCQSPPLSFTGYPGFSCDNPFPITLPFSSLDETTACYGNNYMTATAGICPTYVNGEDKAYSYDASGPEGLSITLSNTITDYVSFAVYQGCPGSGGICIGHYQQAVNGTLSGNVNLASAGTYYIIIDSQGLPYFPYVDYDISVIPYTVGIEKENSLESVSLSPNPSPGIVTIQYKNKSSHISTVTVSNTLGENIYEQKLTSSETQINLSNHPNGIYFVQLRNNEQTITRKILLSK